MKQKIIESSKSLKAMGGYSQALEITEFSRVLFISGQIPLSLDNTVPTDFKSQCELVWNHICVQLEEANMRTDNLVKVTTYLSDRKYREENSAIRQNYLGMHRPSLTVIISGIYDEKWLLEIEAIAAA